MVSPFGMASAHRFAASHQEVDTISHPAYRIEALREVGRFDESLARNSDYELNYRLRAAGERLVFDPTIESIYRPRGSLRALGRQFWWYGRWKVRVVRRHPGSLRPRHLVAPAAVVGAALAPVLATTRPGRRLVGFGVAGYAALVGAAVVTARPREHDADPLRLAAAFPVMHGAWGAGFLASVIEDGVRR
jgi:GT2 family glycosyltransferase